MLVERQLQKIKRKLGWKIMRKIVMENRKIDSIE